MAEVFSPLDEEAVAGIVADAYMAKTPLEVKGAGSKAGLGNPTNCAGTLSLAGLSGISVYEPGALTLVAKAGTSLAEVENALASEGQRLAFEPMDYGGLLGTNAAPTIGGTVAINNSGPRRIQAGACRDSLIGVRFVNGEGHVVKNGGRVMKNVTGLDLVKLMCGSYGTLGVLTEVAFKVLPANEREATLVLSGVDVRDGIRAMSAALGSPFEVTGAAYFPEADLGQTALRVEGFSRQVEYRLGKLKELLGGDTTVLEGVAHDALWQRVRCLSDFAGDDPVWKISVRPSDAPALVTELRGQLEAQVLLDWGGGLVWAQVPAGKDGGAGNIRALTAAVGGHATLIRGSSALRAAIEVFQPTHPRLADISRQLRHQFDPAGILNPGLMAA